MSIVIDIKTRVFDDEDVAYRLFPGQGYRHFTAMKDHSLVFLDNPHIPLPGRTGYDKSDEMLQAIARSEEMQSLVNADGEDLEAQLREVRNKDFSSSRWGRKRELNLGWLNGLYHDAKLGDLIVVPSPGIIKNEEGEFEKAYTAYPLGGNTFGSTSGNWLPLYVGRMIHQFDHRAASVEVNEANLHNAALSGAVSEEQKADPDFVPTPQYWVPESEVDLPLGIEWTIAFRDIARATDARTMIAAIVPKAGFGNKAPLLLPEEVDAYRECADLIAANLNSLALDFVARSKVHSTSVNWFIAEQFPMIPPDKFQSVRFGTKQRSTVRNSATGAGLRRCWPVRWRNSGKS
ncbi:hypothetical protein [Roseovarius sp.]|uniref:hypothetical protein n=1 Tax=Roseovarius sp. TaxID=1486281 RepID=UPI002623E0B2|nr:hypothetical protein [Roseovarius sp.]